MIPPADLAVFTAVVFAAVLVPGLDMALVASTSVVTGRSAGLSVVAGIVAGNWLYVAASALGLGIAAAIPGALDVLLVLGAIYLARVGATFWRTPWMPAPADGRPAAADRAVAFGRGAMTTLLNPKVCLFMVAVLPQFVRREHGSIWSQSAVLGVTIGVVQVAVYGGVALAAGGARGWLTLDAGRGRLVSRVVGTVMLAAAAWSAAAGLYRLAGKPPGERPVTAPTALSPTAASPAPARWALPGSAGLSADRPPAGGRAGRAPA